MGFWANILRLCAFPVALLTAAPAAAADIELFSPETLEISGDLRFVAADGEESWTEGGFGKTRYGSITHPMPGNADLVWRPRIGWALSGTIVGSFVGGPRAEAGLSQAFLSLRPPATKAVRWSARAGLMWPPVSLEHEGADWHVADTVTPSAINSWIGEEVRPASLEGTLEAPAGNGRVIATAAIFAANDTAGTLLALRGWSLHDRKTLAFRRQPLPELNEDMEYIQPRFTHPLLDVAEGFAHRPGYYARLAWETGLPLRIELFGYDNRGDPEAVNEDMEWGWRTRFIQLAAVAEPAKDTEIKFQAMSGHSLMGFEEQDGRRWVDHRFRSAYVLVTHDWDRLSLTSRAEVFDGRQRGSFQGDEDDEEGWALTACGKWTISPSFDALAEFLHVRSSREARERDGEAATQHQSQLQAVLRARW